MSARRRTASEQDILDRVRIQDDGCWIWIGAFRTTPQGGKKPVLNNGYARRLSFTAFVGDVPDDITLSCSCMRDDCVSPDHIVAGDTFPSRTKAATKARATLAKKTEGATHCKAGHEWAVYGSTTRAGTRVCRECARIRMKERRPSRAKPKKQIPQRSPARRIFVIPADAPLTTDADDF